MVELLSDKQKGAAYEAHIEAKLRLLFADVVVEPPVAGNFGLSNLNSADFVVPSRGLVLEIKMPGNTPKAMHQVSSYISNLAWRGYRGEVVGGVFVAEDYWLRDYVDGVPDGFWRKIHFGELACLPERELLSDEMMFWGDPALFYRDGRMHRLCPKCLIVWGLESYSEGTVCIHCK